jgi:hypothetical protein
MDVVNNCDVFDIYIISFTPLNKIYVYFLVSPCDSLSCLNEGSCRVEAGVAACFCKGDYLWIVLLMEILQRK